MPPRLYMIELSAPDWPAAVAWFRDRLGLGVELIDEPNRFALFRCDGGRVALKHGEPAAGASLVFEVDDLSAELLRLQPNSEVKSSSEGYRRAVVDGPPGCRVVFFEWDAAASP